MQMTRRRRLLTLSAALAAPAFLRGRPAFAAEGRALALPPLDEGRLEGGLRR